MKKQFLLIVAFLGFCNAGAKVIETKEDKIKKLFNILRTETQLESDEYKTVEKLLTEDKISPNTFNTKTGYTLLMTAANFGHEKVLNLLLKQGAYQTINAKDKYYGATALCFAINMHRPFSMIKTLLENDANPNIIPKIGYTPLMMAANFGYSKIVDSLLLHGASKTINAQNRQNGTTALYLAVNMNRSPKLVKNLLEHGANPNIIAKTGYTPLMLATHNGNIATIKLLLAHGADINIVGKNGTALDIARSERKTKAEKLLKEYSK